MLPIRRNREPQMRQKKLASLGGDSMRKALSHYKNIRFKNLKSEAKDLKEKP